MRQQNQRLLSKDSNGVIRNPHENTPMLPLCKKKHFHKRIEKHFRSLKWGNETRWISSNIFSTPPHQPECEAEITTYSSAYFVVTQTQQTSVFPSPTCFLTITTFATPNANFSMNLYLTNYDIGGPSYECGLGKSSSTLGVRGTKEGTH